MVTLLDSTMHLESTSNSSPCQTPHALPYPNLISLCSIKFLCALVRATYVL